MKSLKGASVAGLCMALLLPGCSTPIPDAPQNPPSTSSLVEGVPLTFEPAQVAIPSCEPLRDACYRPTLTDDFGGILVTSSCGPLARSKDGGTSFKTVLPPAASLLASCRDSLVLDNRWAMLSPGNLHLAVDGGDSWERETTFVVPPSAERPWMASVGGGGLIVNFQSEAGIMAITSLDGGKTWLGPLPVSVSGRVAGPGVGLYNAAFMVPYWDDGKLYVAISLEGTVWEAQEVPGAAGDLFPAAATDINDVWLAWRSPDHAIHVSRSNNGTSNWSQPIAVTLPGENVVTAPWMQSGDGTVWIGYFTAASDGSRADLHLLKIRDGQVDRGIAAQGIRPTRNPERPANTEFACCSSSHDGRPILVYADGDGAVRIVKVARAGG